MNSPLSILGDTLNKNPICVLNEFSLKTSSKISFEYRTEENEFLALVIYNNQIIGSGKDKKKQVAKTKAADNAVNYLTCKSKENPQEDFEDLLKKFGKKGTFKLSFQDPIFIYEYFLSGSLISEGRDQSESQAKEKCVKNLNEKLTILEEKTLKKPSTQIRPDLLQPLKKKPKHSDLDSSNFPSSPSENSSFFEDLLLTEALSNEDHLQLSELEANIKSLSKALDLNLIPVGSYALGQLRKSRLILDFCLVVESKNLIPNIFESLEKARMVYLKYKECESVADVFALSYSPRLVKKNENFFILFENDGKFSFRFFFTDDPEDTFLKFYALKGKRKEKVEKASKILKHWRCVKGLNVKSEILEVLVREIVDDRDLALGVRGVVEVIAAGALVDGSSFRVKDDFFREFGKMCSLDEIRSLMIEAVEFLMAFHQRNFKEYFG
jgi:hypothetical protein